MPAKTQLKNFTDVRSELSASDGVPAAAIDVDAAGFIGINTASPDRLLHSEVSDGIVNAVTYALRLSHISSGTVAASFGTGLEIELEGADGTNLVASTIETIWTDASTGAEDADLIFKLALAGVAAVEAARLKSNADFNLITGGAFQINDVDVLNATTLGGAVTNSSLTNLGTLTALTLAGTLSFTGAQSITTSTGDLTIQAASVTAITLDDDGNHTWSSTLDAATGNEIALALNYTVNKATSGDDTGFLIAQTDTLSPGMSRAIRITQGGAERIQLRANGDILLSGLIFSMSNDATLGIQTRDFTVADNAIEMLNGTTVTNSSGNFVGLKIQPEINQTLTAGYTGILLDATETATGSGAKNLLDLQIGGVSKFSIDNAGLTKVAGDIYSTAWTTFGGSSTIVGWADPLATSELVNYKKVGNLVFVQFYLDGVSDTTAVTFTLPFTQINTNGVELKVPIQVADNSGAIGLGLLVLGINSATANCFSDMAGTAWTASNNKRVQGQFWYESIP